MIEVLSCGRVRLMRYRVYTTIKAVRTPWTRSVRTIECVERRSGMSRRLPNPWSSLIAVSCWLSWRLRKTALRNSRALCAMSCRMRVAPIPRMSIFSATMATILNKTMITPTLSRSLVYRQERRYERRSLIGRCWYSLAVY